MKWNSYTIETTTAAEDLIVAMLDDLGIEGAMIENHVPLTQDEIGEMFIDFPPELGEDDGSSKVTFYLDADESTTGEREALLKKVMLALEEQNVVTARSNHAIACERFLLGDLSGIEMREAQQSLLDAEERILEAQYNTKVCEISLKVISGRVMEYIED